MLALGPCNTLKLTEDPKGLLILWFIPINIYVLEIKIRKTLKYSFKNNNEPIICEHKQCITDEKRPTYFKT